MMSEVKSLEQAPSKTQSKPEGAQTEDTISTDMIPTDTISTETAIATDTILTEISTETAIATDTISTEKAPAADRIPTETISTDTPVADAIPAEKAKRVMSILLSYLPREDLAECRAVCQEWKYYIDREHFDIETVHRLRRRSPPPAILILDETIITEHNRPRKTVVIFPNPFEPTAFPPQSQTVGAGVRLTSPRMGLLCLISKTGNLRIMNPATHPYRDIPMPPNYTVGELMWFCLCFNPASNKYTVLHFHKTDRALRVGCQLYSFGEGWKAIEGPDPDITPCKVKECVCLNGTMYWDTRGSQNACAKFWKILAFNTQTEKFSRIIFKVGEFYANRASCTFLSLFEHEGCVCLAVSISEGISEEGMASSTSIHVWMLLDGPKNDWKRVLTFSSPWRRGTLRPLVIHEGRIVAQLSFGDGEGLVVVDPATGAVEHLYKAGTRSYFFPHAESVVNPLNLSL